MSLRSGVGRARRRAHALGRLITGANDRARARLDGTRAVVLMYHRVLPSREAEQRCVEPGMYVTPQTFADHVDWLCRDFAILPLQEIASRLREGRALPEGACAITFDDGWRDNIDHALPVLEGKGVPATIFAVTSRVGTLGAFWPDEVSRILSARSSSDGRALVKQIGVEVASGEALQATLAFLKEASEAERPALLERLWEAASHELDTARELLDWEELETLSRRGVDIESHGVSHAILTGLPMDEVRRELEHALVALRERGLGRHGLFAYPSGGFDAGIAKLAKDVGYRVAVTTQPGLVSASTNPMTLPRIGIHQDISSTRAEFLRWVPGEVRPIEGSATR